EQPLAWLRHQAVLASALAIASMTWKKETGSVSMPSDERGIRSRNSWASCSLSSSGSGRRRLSSISSAAASTAGRTASAREITAGSPARSAEDGINVSKDASLQRSGPGSGWRHAELAVDLLVRLAAGFQPEEIVDHPGHQEPAAEIEEG